MGTRERLEGQKQLGSDGHEQAIRRTRKGSKREINGNEQQQERSITC